MLGAVGLVLGLSVPVVLLLLLLLGLVRDQAGEDCCDEVAQLEE